MRAVGTESLPLFETPAVTRVRSGDPGPSHQAAAAVRNLTARHRAVYEVLRRRGPATDHEIEAAYDRFRAEPWWVPQTAQSLRSRRALLGHAHYGLVVDARSRRPSPNGGHPSTVWAAVDQARAAAIFGRVERSPGT